MTERVLDSNWIPLGEAATRVVCKQRPIYRLLLRPEPRVDAERALRALLKIALRRLGLRCVSVEELRR
jgi:hypothetical protein